MFWVYRQTFACIQAEVCCCAQDMNGLDRLAFLSIFREQIWFIEGHFCVHAEKTLDEPEMWTVLHWFLCSCFSFNIPWTDLVYRGSFLRTRREDPRWARDVNGLTLVSLFLLFFQYSVNRSGLSRVIFAYPQRRPSMSQRCERSYIGWLVVLNWFELNWIVLYYIYLIILLYIGGVVIHPNSGFQVPNCSFVKLVSLFVTLQRSGFPNPTAERTLLVCLFVTLQRSGFSNPTAERTLLVCLFLLFFQYSVNRSGLSRVIFAYPQRRPSMSQRCERSYIGFFVLAFLSIFREQIWFIEGHFCVPAEKTLDEPEMWTVLHWLIGCIELIWIELYCIVLYFFIIPSIPRWGVTTPKLYSDHCPSSDLSYRFDLLAFLSVFIFFIRHPGTEWIL